MMLLLSDFHSKFGKTVGSYVFRISMRSDLKRVQHYGSTRLGLSDKPWVEASRFDLSHLHRTTPIRHEEVVIASQWVDLIHDAELPHGTLAHKLNIYERPFFTVYNKSALYELGQDAEASEQNQGRHYLFIQSPLKALDSLWQIHQHTGVYTVSEIV